MTTLIIDAAVREKFARLRARAVAEPVDLRVVGEQITTPEGEVAHIARMRKLTMEIPGPHPWRLSFSIDLGADNGPVRHLSLSVMRAGRTPNQISLWLVASELGFIGSVEDCDWWLEEIGDDRKAVHLAQSIRLHPAARA
jgi:hypothetical protein